MIASSASVRQKRCEALMFLAEFFEEASQRFSQEFGRFRSNRKPL